MKLIQTQKITQQRHLNLFRSEYRDQRGARRSWIYASRQKAARNQTNDWARPDAVVIVPWHTERQELVVIKEYRVVLGGYQIGFPAGLMDAGETLFETARRELFEETGLSMKQVVRYSPPVYSSSGMSDEAIALVYVECGGTPSDRANESSEDIEVVFVDAGAAASLINDPGHKIDVKTWMALSEFARWGRL